MIAIDLTMIVMINFHHSTMHWLKIVWHDVIISDSNHCDVDAMIAINVTMIVMINYHDSIRQNYKAQLSAMDKNSLASIGSINPSSAVVYNNTEEISFQTMIRYIDLMES